ncbi:hypothetical protein AB0C27_43365 [Nonomuraea sp. NPDC048882]|uniref:hypothetical protein n=1 Tax=unclassified Nonomuraea TaxID=2593643 RepID=UPI0033C02A25
MGERIRVKEFRSHPLIFEKDITFWYETLRSFGHIAYGGADFGEVVTTAQRITEGDYDSWHDQ